MTTTTRSSNRGSNRGKVAGKASHSTEKQASTTRARSDSEEENITVSKRRKTSKSATTAEKVTNVAKNLSEKQKLAIYQEMTRKLQSQRGSEEAEENARRYLPTFLASTLQYLNRHSSQKPTIIGG